jgi:Tol biopolymer transport system component
VAYVSPNREGIHRSSMERSNKVCQQILAEILPIADIVRILVPHGCSILGVSNRGCYMNEIPTAPTKIERMTLVSVMVSGLLFSEGVIACVICLLLTIASLTIGLQLMVQPVLAQATVAAGVRLEAGIEKEDVDGDLPAAMDIFQKIAVDKSAPRDVRSRALLRLARCDEKLGRQAKQIYEQILRDYADQPEAAQARNRLALLRRQEHPAEPSTMTVRKIESSAMRGMSTSDTDGERAIYRVGNTLYFGDVAGVNRHIILKNMTFYGWEPSKDFSLIALNLLRTPNRPHTLAVMKTDGTGYRELIRDDDQSSIFGENGTFSINWSWDNRYLVLFDFSLNTGFEGRLWIVSVADGQRRELARVENARIRRALVSPDGRFIAYEVWAKTALAQSTSRIFVVPAQGGEPRLVYETYPWQVRNAYISIQDWTADGRYIALEDIRPTISALYLLPVKNGAADGAATFVRFGDFDDGVTTLSGALIYMDRSAVPANRDVSLGSFDSAGEIESWRTLELRASVDPEPSFSPDGSEFAYIANNADPTRRDLILRNILTGSESAIYQSSSGTLDCQFSFRTPKVFCTVGTEDGHINLISIDAVSGSVEQISSFPEYRILLQPPVDDRVFFFGTGSYAIGRLSPLRLPIARWDRVTKQETIVLSSSDKLLPERPSLDGRWVIRFLDGAFSIRPLESGDWKPLVSGALWPTLTPVTTPDGKWFLYIALDANGKHRLFRAPIDGGAPQLAGDLPIENYAGRFYFRADGRQVLAQDSTTDHYNLWVLRNFEPSAKK